MFSKLKEIASGAAKSVGGQFAKASSAIADLAASLATRAAAAADLGRILDIIEMVPGVKFERPEIDAGYLDTLLAAVQMGELTLAIHYRKETEASVVRLHPLPVATANELTGSDRFFAKVLINGDDDKPAIQMLINSEHLANNYRHVTADTLINALAFPIENVKGGFIIARSFRAIARPIAGWLLGIIFDQGEKLRRRFRNERDDDVPQPTSPPSGEQQIDHPAAASTASGDSDGSSSGVRSNKSTLADDDHPMEREQPRQDRRSDQIV